MTRLDNERPNWRINTIIKLDGAKYHVNKSTR